MLFTFSSACGFYLLFVVILLFGVLFGCCFIVDIGGRFAWAVARNSFCEVVVYLLCLVVGFRFACFRSCLVIGVWLFVDCVD